uniref:ubiquitinyl hydrolase 1 n=1 Tax=Strigamia maritima TaxID=126957 RepID=T1IZS4_STRMM
MTIAMRGAPNGGGDSPQETSPGQNATNNSPQPPQPQVQPQPAQLQQQQQLPQPQPQQQQTVASQSPTDENFDLTDHNGELSENQEPDFPHAELNKLDEMINRPRWRCIMKNCERLIELCVTKLSQDWFPLLDLLAMVLNPNNKFHTYNGTRPSETVPPGSQIPDEELYARPPDARTPRGWLVDLINRFGQLGGFQILSERFSHSSSLSVPVIAALIRPFGLCFELLTVHTIEKHFMPIVDIIPIFLENLTDDELKKEAKNEAKNDALSAIIKALKCLVFRVPNQEETAKNLEIFRLKMILRLLQISSFNGKMNALNEVNKVIASVSYYSHRHSGIEEEEWLTADRMAEWIKENKVLQIVLRDSLHQPQYVEKLEKIIRFVIKEKSLTLEDLDNIWAAQAGKHEAIVKNVHDLLAKLAWDFSPEQLDHLFDCFQMSWASATKKQREKLLELIRRLAEDDKDGVMAHKVLTLLWNLAHSDDVPTEIMDQALSAHVKILDYSCSQDRDAQKTQWLDKCVEELKNDKWVLPALKQIREICCLYTEAPANFNHAQRSPHMFYRHEIINRLQQQHTLVILVADNLTNYMNKARLMAKEISDLDPNAILPDSRYSHVHQVQERLNFLRFLLKDGQLWLCAPQAKQIWQCLAENAVYLSDREACFKWFSKLMGDEPDLDPEINRDFFESNILQLDPCLLTENGMKCFDRFFKAVNFKEGKLVLRRRTYLMDDLELVGLDYIWKVVLCSGEEIATKAIELLKETYTNLGPHLQASQVDIHEDFVQLCMDRLKAAYDTISVLEKDKDSVNRIRQETTRMVRVLKVLHEYISECDGDYGEERNILPMARSFRGKHVSLTIRFPNQGRQVEDLDVWSHTNDTLASIRRQILNRIKGSISNMKVDLFVNGELIDPAEDKKLISEIPLRDKTLITGKLCQVGSNMPSSPDSSSDSSTGSPQHPYDGPNAEAESSDGQPGPLRAIFFQLADLGSSMQVAPLRDGGRALLKLMPNDVKSADSLRALCLDHAKLGDQSLSATLESVFFASSPSQVLYSLEVTYSLLMPALNPMSEEAFEFQFNFIKSGGVSCVLGMLTKNNFLPNADPPTKRAAYHVVLKICKLMLTTVGHSIVNVVAEAIQPESTTMNVTPSAHNHAVVVQQALHHIPNVNAECMLRNVALRLAQNLLDQATGHLPDMATIRAIIKIAWASSTGSTHLVHCSYDDLHKLYDKSWVKPVNSEENQPETEDLQVCKEALEVLTIALALYPQALETLTKDKAWHLFIVDLLLLSKNRSVRVSAAEQFLLIATKCSGGQQPLIFFITLLFTVLLTTVKEHAKNCHEYFQLFCRLLNYACASSCQLANVEGLLSAEIQWLKDIRTNVLQSGDSLVEEALLEGHLGIARELVSFLSTDKKYEIGSHPSKSVNLIKELVEDFIFPASKVVLQFQKNGEMPSEQAIPVCSTPLTVIAAFDLLVSLSTGCVPNLKILSEMITEMYYSDKDQSLTEWEYLPPIGPRPLKGFVGLKNAGATCYMNSVLQQLYMIDDVRHYILSVEGAATDPDEDFSGEEKMESENNIDNTENDSYPDDRIVKKEESRKEYNMGVLKQVQAIFGHLASSKLQYYVPRGLWKHFKLGGEPVNLREQHDALEFFNSLVDSIDESLKVMGHDQVLSKILGGSFADQKICRDCPHRYSREESFTTLNIDIRNHCNLLDSLEQYVKGDLLEGANAYHCEKCNKKVDTVKRMCIKKLPPILAIQLKRFDYDWERECAIKFNDYFEFPRDLDMEPYTVWGLAKMEGEIIHAEDELDEDELLQDPSCTKYKLKGIVVHSGQASGGHYYSYILHRHSDGTYKWYKFDDGEVTECKMDDDEEMKNQCFGGEYMGEVFDHMHKRMSYRRQKRWWNAYILFYQRLDVDEGLMTRSLNELCLADKASTVKMPLAIERSVRKQNVKFMHNRNQFSLEYFQFMKKLIGCNGPYVTLQTNQEKLSEESEELAMISIQLASKFLFTTGFHTKKTLRSSANEWYDAVCIHLRNSKKVRSWFATNVLFAHPHRFSEYLLECPSTEVRTAFVKVLVFLAHFSLHDGPYALPGTSGSQVAEPNSTLSDHLLQAVLGLLKKEVSEHGRHLAQYFSLFLMYSSLGVLERKELLKLNVPATFMLVALDEGPGPPIKYQYAELGKLYQVVSQLIRCCDVSSKMQSSVSGNAPLANIHGDHMCPDYIMPIQSQVAEILYARTSYVKKIIEDANTSEDTIKLLKFCSWENPHFSSMVLSELLWQIAYSYTYELRPYLDLLLHMLILEDSWQNHRIHNALKGIPDDRDGLFDTIQRSKNHYQKRAYQCIKCMVTLFSTCTAAAQMLHSNGELKRKWTWAVEWLNDELERRPYSASTQYAYNNWSPPAQSNETSNG